MQGSDKDKKKELAEKEERAKKVLLTFMDAGYLLSITYSHDVCSSFWTIVASLEPPKNGYWLNKCQLGSLPHVF